MLTYSFENKKNESLYDYLYECIKADIVSGKLSAHEKLPSKRAFANNHGISVATVEATYGQLQAEGYIYSKPSSGFFVAPIEYYFGDKQPKAEGNTVGYEKPVGNENALGYEYSASRPGKRAEQTLYMDGVPGTSTTGNTQALEHFPFSIWAKISRRLLTDQDAKLLTVPPAGGAMELREAITEHLYDFRGINVKPEQVIIGAGTEYLYGLIVQLFGRDKVYGLESPCSKKIRSIYSSLGANLVSLPMDDEGVITDSEQLKRASIIQISPSHQFPTGVVSSASRRYSLLRWASEQTDRFIIEDDYDSEFRLQGKPIPALFSMDGADKVIYFNTFTKSLTATIRISYMVLPESLLPLFYEKLGFYACTVSNFEQYTLAAFIKEKHFEKHINRMRNRYRLLREEFVKGLNESDLADNVTICEEDAGLHFLLKLDVDKSEGELKKSAREQGLKLTFISDYYDTEACLPAYEKTAIISYAVLGVEGSQAVVDKLNSAWG